MFEFDRSKLIEFASNPTLAKEHAVKLRRWSWLWMGLLGLGMIDIIVEHDRTPNYGFMFTLLFSLYMGNNCRIGAVLAEAVAVLGELQRKDQLQGSERLEEKLVVPTKSREQPQPRSVVMLLLVLLIGFVVGYLIFRN